MSTFQKQILVDDGRICDMLKEPRKQSINHERTEYNWLQGHI